MMSIRTIAAVAAATGLLAAAGAPAAVAQSTPAPAHPTDSAQPGKPGKKGKHRRRGPRRLSDAQLTRVAEALGTGLAALKAAEAKVKAAVDASEARETRAERDALLAAELGVTVEKLRSAFDSVRGSAGGRCRDKGAQPAPDSPSDGGA